MNHVSAVCGLALLVGSPAGYEEPPPRPSDQQASPSATATNPAVPAFGHSLHGESFNEGPRQFATLLPGMGRITFTVTTVKPGAQAFINQGVAQLHSFYYFEAERSFRQAAFIDSSCAMAYWGAAMANVNNPQRARGFLKEARSWAAKKKVSRREQLYLDALSALHAEGGKGRSGMPGLVVGLETIVQEFPADLDARAWLVLALLLSDSLGSRVTADAMLDSVLRAEPLHPGAHHYRIHLWDQHQPTSALGSAAAYASAAPGVAHAWHMPGHTYTELKRYADAAYHQEASARVDHASMARDHIMPFEIDNYVHNNQWLCTSLSHIGRVRDAVAIARNLVEIPRDPDKNSAQDGGSAQRSGRLRWVEALIRHELWDDLIKATATGALDWSEIPFERMMHAYSLGLAYAARGDRARLDDQIAALRRLVGQQKGGASSGRTTVKLEIDTSANVDPAEIARQVTTKLKAATDERSRGADASPRRPIDREAPGATPGSDGEGVTADTALAELEGHDLMLAGDVGAAFVRFSKATAMRPEARARAHLKVRNYAFAESTAKLGVERYPGQVSQLAAYVEVLHAVGKDKEARDVYHTLTPLAREADQDLPTLRRIASIMASSGVNGGGTSTATQASSDEPPVRVDLKTLGPLTWSPYSAPGISCPDAIGKRWSLTEHHGRIVVVVLYLGSRCSHCLQQLQVFGKHADEWKSLDVELVGVSTDDVNATKALIDNPDGVKFGMLLLADPALEVFKSYRCYDDFEGQPLHGIFLIDTRGQVRYQRVSADPFLDVDFVKREIDRIRRFSLGAPSPGGIHGDRTGGGS